MTTQPVSTETLLAQLQWRYATKAFDSSKKISTADWSALEQALILTPTSFGIQPYRFVIITDQATKDQLVPHSWGQKQPAESSHFVVFAAKISVSEADIEHYVARTAEVRGITSVALAGFKKVMINSVVDNVTPEWQHEWAIRQSYIALGNFMTAAALLGIDTCPMEGIAPAEYDKVLDLPAKGYRTVVACAAGYRSSADKYASAPKVRFPASELVIHI